MRRRLLLILPLLLAACDSGSPDPTSADALAGEWVVERAHAGVVAISDRAQAVVDVSAEAQSGIEVSGADDAELRFLWYAFPGSHAGFGTSRQNEPGCTGAACPDPYTLLVDVLGERVELRGRSQPYEAESSAIDLRETADGYALAPITLTQRGGTATVTVGGEIVLATRSLVAGRATPTALFFSSPSYSTGSEVYTFREDGTYGYRSPSGYQSGTWSVAEPGLAELTPESGVAYRFAFEVRDGRLWSAVVRDATPAPASAEIEAQVRAAAGSLSLLVADRVTVSSRAD